MSTAVVDHQRAGMPPAAPTLDDIAFAHTWLLRMQQEHPDIPEALLRAYFESQAAPSVNDLMHALACDHEHAASWQRVLAVRLISPGHYVDLFASEETVSERQRQWQRHQDDVHATAAELAAVQQAIELKLAESRMPAYEAAATEELARLDTDDARLRRKQERLPGAGALLQTALAEAQAGLAEAQQALTAAQVEALQQVEELWLQDLVASLEPARAMFKIAGWLTQRWEQLGIPTGHEHGLERLRDEALRRLRR